MNDQWKKILTTVKKGDVRCVYLLHGDEEYKVDSARRQLMELLVSEADRSLNLVALDGAEVTWGEVLAHLRTTSMFGGRKVVVVKDARLGEGPDKAFEKARKAWAEEKRGRAANIMMGILGEVDWPLESLSDGGPDARDKDSWCKEAGIKGFKSDDFEWMGELLDYALKQGLLPAKNDDTEKLEDFISRADPAESVLVLVAGAADKRTSFYKAVDRYGDIIPFVAPRGDFKKRSSLKREIDRAAAKAGKKVDGSALRRLELKTGFDFRRAMGEIEKLIVFVGDAKVITARDVDAVVPRTKEESIFELNDAFATRKASVVLRLVDELESSGHHPLELLGLIHSQLRNLLLASKYAADMSGKKLWNPRMNYSEFQKITWKAIKESVQKGENGADSAGSATGKKKKKTKSDRWADLEKRPNPIFPGLHPFVAFNALKNQANYKTGDLVRAFRILAEVDDRVKRSAGDELFLVEQAFLAICANRHSFLENRRREF